MTFEDDFVLLQTESGPRRYALSTLGLQWPPPALINLLGFPFRRQRMSEITDEKRAGMTHVCRGAEYVPETPV